MSQSMQTRIAGKEATAYRDENDAQTLADRLRRDDPDWRYAVQQIPGGWFYVAVFDHDGYLLGPL